MRIKNKEVVDLKRRLMRLGIKGLALDIDETLSFTIERMIDELTKKFGNPENLTAKEIFEKYRHTDNIPYWQNEEAKLILDEIVNSNEAQKDLPLVKNANKTVQEINKTVPIMAYITVRPKRTINGTIFWLKKHNFPEATVIAKPNSISRKMGNKWKAKVLEYLYPEILGIVDDSENLQKFFKKGYKGVDFLYGGGKAIRDDLAVVSCGDWKDVAEKVGECRL